MPGEKTKGMGHTDKRVRLVSVHSGIQQGSSHHIHYSARSRDDQHVLLGNLRLKYVGRKVARKAFLQVRATIITGRIPTSGTE